MNIALICTEKNTVPPVRGGAIQIFLDGVSMHLSSRHQVTIYCITDTQLPDREIVDGVAYVRVPQEHYVLGVAGELMQQRKAGHIYDIIHVCNRPRDFLIYKTAMPESRFVISLHNEMFKEGKISKELGHLVVRAVDRIMTVSDYIGQTIIDRFPSARPKVQTVYSGIDLKRYKPLWAEEAQEVRNRLRQKFGVSQRKVVLFVGRISAVKGPDILIQAMEAVIRAIPDAAIVIVGSKWFSDDSLDDYGIRVRQMAEKLGDRVVFTGFVQPVDIPDHFLIGDVFVCSSQWQEPLARVHYEAMGAGLPVITTRRGGNAEIVSDSNGIVIEDYANPHAFADAMVKLFTHPAEADRLARAGRALMEEGFGFQHVAARLENLYLQAIRRRKANSTLMEKER